MSFASPVVFIVHRNPGLCHALRTAVCQAGWEAVTLASAEGFPVHAHQPGPSCLLLEAVENDHAWRTVQERTPVGRTPVILLAGYLDIATVVKAMKSGVVEVLTTPFRDEKLMAAIREALDLSRRVLAREAAIESVKMAYASLSRRERQVMALVAQGYLNKQVGGRLGISEITVKTHRGRVMHKMKAGSLPALVRMVDGLERSSTTGTLNPGSTANGGTPYVVSSSTANMCTST